MTKFTRAELEAAFLRYKERGADAVARGDWNAWADQFTEDAVYVEHHYGTFHGREAIREWISSTMAPVPDMHFPVEWAVFDEEHGWVVFLAWNQMSDPDGNGPYRAGSWSKLIYAGNDQWSYEEDMYNPTEFTEMLKRWSAAKRAKKGSSNAG